MSPDRHTALALAAGFASMALVFVTKTFADTVFLGAFGVTYVPHLYVALAVLVVSSASAYGLLVRRGVTLVVDLAILGGLLAVSVAGPALVGLGGAWIFAVAVALQWLPTMAGLALYNAATAGYSGRRGRRFLPKIGAATTLGAVVGSFGATALVGLFGIDALAYFAGVLAAGATVARVGLHRGTDTILAPQPRKRRGRREVGAARSLVTLLAVAAVIEALMSAVLDFGFKRAATESFDDATLGVFLSLFYGGTNATILLLQLLATRRVLATRSLRRTLSVEPVVLLAIGASWALAPSVVLATAGRAGETVLKFALARPSQEIALAPLTAGARQRWKVLLRGVFNQLGAVIGGLLLFVLAPWLAHHPAVVPGLVAGLASVWLLAQRAVGSAYLETLGSALGLRRLSIDEEREGAALDAEGVGRVVEMLDDVSPELRAFADELLAHAEVGSADLARELTRVGPRARVRLYEQIARRPDAAGAAQLRAAVARESAEDPAPLRAGLRALALHGDTSGAELARALAGDGPPEAADDDALDGWLYLAQVGALDNERGRLDAVLTAALARRGVRAAELYRAAIERGAFPADRADAEVTEAVVHATGTARVQALSAAAALGRFKPLSKLLATLELDTGAVVEALAHLEASGLYRLVGLVTSRSAPAATRARLLRALRGCDLPEMSDVATAFLVDPDPSVREVAVRQLIKHLRERELALPRDAVERTVALELDAFERYARARPGYPLDARESMMMLDLRRTAAANASRETLFDDELERRTENALGRLCATLALLGSPEVVYAAERALRSPEFKQRRQAVDVLQEVARGRQRARLLELLELYLLPPTEYDEAARKAVCEFDPWFARCAAGNFDEYAAQLAALRSTSLFGDVDPEALVDLAATAVEHRFERGEIVVRQGDAGDALYVVVEGQLAVVVDDKVVQTLTPGDSFGELAVLDGRPRQATVKAVVRARLLSVPEAAFTRAFDNHPTIGLGLVRGLARWMRDALDPRQSLITSSGTYRRGTLEPSTERTAR